MRAYVGDILVVILIYTFLKSFFEIKNDNKLILCIFAFAFLVELLQFFSIATYLGFETGSVGYIVIGNHFSWADVLCYAVGCFLIKIFNFCFLEKSHRID